MGPVLLTEVVTAVASERCSGMGQGLAGFQANSKGDRVYLGQSI